MTAVTVGFVPRERFSLAPESLKTILESTGVDFQLIVVDCNTPEISRSKLQELLAGRKNATVIGRDRYLLPNECRNLVMQQAMGDYVCLIENDNLVDPQWLSRFLLAMNTHEADVVIPLIMEGRPGHAKVHFDEGLGRVRTVETPTGAKWEVVARKGKKEDDVNSDSRPQEFMETHCLFFRRSILDRIGPFDEHLNTSEEIDLSLALYAAGARCIFAPQCYVHYVQPPQPVDDSDRGYFLTKWDIENARKSHSRIQSRWNLTKMPQLLGFVEERNLRGSARLHLWQEELAALARGKPFILVDMQQWAYTKIVDGLTCVPFTENNGLYWGPPANDDIAIQELQRLRAAGISTIVFAWHAFWWFEYYSGFHKFLNSRFRKISASDHLVAFDLQVEGV